MNMCCALYSNRLSHKEVGGVCHFTLYMSAHQ